MTAKTETLYLFPNTEEISDILRSSVSKEEAIKKILETSCKTDATRVEKLVHDWFENCVDEILTDQEIFMVINYYLKKPTE